MHRIPRRIEQTSECRCLKDLITSSTIPAPIQPSTIRFANNEACGHLAAFEKKTGEAAISSIAPMPAQYARKLAENIFVDTLQTQPRIR